MSKRFGGLARGRGARLRDRTGRSRSGSSGRNGAGKTTLFALIAGEVVVAEGAILLEGVRIEAVAHRTDERGLGLGRTYQRLEVFPEMTVLEHLLVALGAHRGSTA